jgi:hypothetical protein
MRLHEASPFLPHQRLARTLFVLLLGLGPAVLTSAVARGQALRAGVGRVDVTGTPDNPPDDRLYARALVLEHGTDRVVVVTLDVVAIGGIGPIGNDFLDTLRGRLRSELGIDPGCVVVNASHCHGRSCGDVGERTFRAVRDAARAMVPVQVGAGVGFENRIVQNRRLRLRNGREADVRHAYALPPDEEVVGLGPVDPEIGLLRLDRTDGRTLAVLFNFACHPILGVPGGRNTADLSGFASRVVEENLGEGAIALFVQGCGGDINPVFYKGVDLPRNAEAPGNMLGLSVLKALRRVQTRDDDRLRLIREVLRLPRADHTRRIAALEAEQVRLARSLRGTSLNLKTFLPLAVKYGLSSRFPSYTADGYLGERAIGRDDLGQLDAENRRNLEEYVANVHVMEELTRVQTNLELLKKHQADNSAAASRTVDAELVALRVGDFVLTTFPGELTVQIGLNIKKASPHARTFVAGYTNGYLYYAPTDEQLRNPGTAQEDCDCLLGPGWQTIYESKVAEMLPRL